MDSSIRIEKENEEFGRLYAESGLELGENWSETAVFTLACREDSVLLGAATVSFRFERYILDFVAVKEDLRRSGIGKKLVSRCIEECRKRGAGELWLQARTPAFFKRIGASETGGTTLLCECLACPDYGKSCSPVEMRFEWRSEQ